LKGTGPGLAQQDAAGKVFEQFWNRTEQFFGSDLAPLVGYLDPLLSLRLCCPGCGGHDYNSILLGDRYWRKNSPIEGELELGLYLQQQQLWRTKEVQSVYMIHQGGWAWDSPFGGRCWGQGHQTWGCRSDLASRWKSWASNRCERCCPCERNKQLAIQIEGNRSQTMYCLNQWLCNQDIQQLRGRICWHQCTRIWRTDLVQCGCWRDRFSVKRCIKRTKVTYVPEYHSKWAYLSWALGLTWGKAKKYISPNHLDFIDPANMRLQ
jgi:hypothetical protein